MTTQHLEDLDPRLEEVLANLYSTYICQHPGKPVPHTPTDEEDGAWLYTCENCGLVAKYYVYRGHRLGDIPTNLSNRPGERIRGREEWP